MIFEYNVTLTFFIAKNQKYILSPYKMQIPLPPFPSICANIIIQIYEKWILNF